jgi:hypothetical protein
MGNFLIAGAASWAMRTARRCLLGQRKRVKHIDLLESGKILNIEGQDIFDPMHQHGRNQPGVVNIFCANLVIVNQLLPVLLKRKLWQQYEKLLEGFQFVRRLPGRIPQAICVDRTCNHGPELDKILLREAKRLIPAAKRFESHGRHLCMGMVRLDQAQKNIGIQKDSP